MLQTRTVQATLLFTILVLASILPGFLITPVHAETTNETTTLYFVPYNPLEGGTGETYNQELSTTPPTYTNDSEWPPSLLIKEKIILPSINSEEWLAWFQLWTMYKITNAIGEEYSDILDSFFGSYNPMKVSQDYLYTGEDPVEIKGDIQFNIFLNSNSKLLRKDSVKVSIAKAQLFGSTEIKNTSQIISPTLLKDAIKPYMLTISIDDEEDVILNPNDILTCAVEIIPSERFMGNVLRALSDRGFEDKIINLVNSFATFLSNRNLEKLKNLGGTIQEFVNMSEMFGDEGVNFTVGDIGDLLDSLKSSSFVFGSANHQSSVTIPFSTASPEQSNTVLYYLHQNNEMDTTSPISDESQEYKISTGAISWESPSLIDTFDRSKILTEADATFHFDYRNILNLRKITLKATLYDDTVDNKIASQEIQLDRTKLLDLLQKTSNTLVFSFPDLTYELSYDHSLGLKLEVANSTKLGLRKLYVLYDSTIHSSSLKTRFEETTNIDFTITADPSSKEIIPGGNTTFALNITSNLADEITVDTKDQKTGQWDISIKETLPITCTAGETQTVHVIVTSTNNMKDAYGDMINSTIQVTGKTGYAEKTQTVEVSRNAVIYDFNLEIDDEPEIGIKRGETGNFSFKIVNNNTGAIDDDDSYEIEINSDNNWDVNYDTLVNNLRIGKQKTLVLTISVPENISENSDILTVTITSEADSSLSETFEITVNVINDNILEMIYEFFKSTAAELGLDELFGSDIAPIALASILFIIVFFILIIIALLATSRYVTINSIERIKEIQPDETAIYEITLTNPTKRSRTYDITIRQKQQSSWKTSTDAKKILVEPKQSQTITLSVTPTDQVQKEEWIEIGVEVGTIGKRRVEELSFMTILADGTLNLKITNMFHWPKDFKENDRIISSFRVENNRKLTAKNISIKLFINEKEKNKVEDITIPGRSYADIKLPWIAEKGKNKLHITVTQN